MPALDGLVAIVTGASAGIGEATARRLAGAGADVVISARRGERLDRIAREIEKAGGRAHPVAADVTDAADRERLVAEAMDIRGRIDALINNAGYGQRGPIEMVPIEKIRKNFETNVFSLIALTQLVIPIMRAQRSGRIVNVSSIAGRVARPMSSVYDSTKHALEAISDGLRPELAPFGIKVVIVEPGFILTEFLQVANSVSKPEMDRESPYSPYIAALQRGYKRARRAAGRPDDIARLVEKALTVESPRARYAAPAHAKLVLLLKRLLPDRPFDRLIAWQTGMSGVPAPPGRTEPGRRRG